MTHNCSKCGAVEEWEYCGCGDSIAPDPECPDCHGTGWFLVCPQCEEQGS